jgi:hypothetical protein
MGLGLRSDLSAKLNLAAVCVALALVGAIVAGVF